MAYTEQITFLLFLKMADEQTKPPYNRPPIVPPELGWPSLLARDGDELEVHYRHILEELGRQPGMLGEIFRKARPEIQNPATLKKLIVDLIDQETWLSMDADVKGDIYEGLLSRSAQESPKGAGQYFTPRPLIKAIVDVMQPSAEDTICDPACGTGGFLLAAHDYVVRHHGAELDPDQKKHLRAGFVHGVDIVPATARLGLMNLYLHGISATRAADRVGRRQPCPGSRRALQPGAHQSALRQEEQHHHRQRRRRAREGGPRLRASGLLDHDQQQAAQLRAARPHPAQGRTAAAPSSCPTTCCSRAAQARRCAATCCSSATSTPCCACRPASSTPRASRPTSCSSTRSRRREEPWTERLWVYDLRTNMHFTQKEHPLQRQDLDEFVECYRPGQRHERVETWSEANPDGRWRSYSYEELAKRDKLNLDMFWLRDKSLEESEDLPEPDVIAQEIVEDLQAALEQFAAVAAKLQE